MPELYPNFLAVNPDGTISAVFPGGLVIPSSTAAAPPPGRAIKFIDTDVTQELRNEEFVSEGAAGGGFIFHQDTVYRGSADQEQLGNILRVAEGVPRGSDGVAFTSRAQIQASRSLGALWGVFASILTPASSQGATVLDSNGASTFLKLASDANVEIAFGQLTVNFAANSISSDAPTVAHGLGAAPTVVLALPAQFIGAATAANAFHVVRTSSDATNIVFRGFTNTGANLTGTPTFYWAAIAIIP